jgi:hypothetical protein
MLPYIKVLETGDATLVALDAPPGDVNNPDRHEFQLR